MSETGIGQLVGPTPCQLDDDDNDEDNCGSAEYTEDPLYVPSKHG